MYGREHPASSAWNIYCAKKVTYLVAKAAYLAARAAFEAALVGWRGCGKPLEMEKVIDDLRYKSSITFSAYLEAELEYLDADLNLYQAISESESESASVEEDSTTTFFDDDRLWRRPRHRYHRRNVRR